jgi:hypothetical protein
MGWFSLGVELRLPAWPVRCGGLGSSSAHSVPRATPPLHRSTRFRTKPFQLLMTAANNASSARAVAQAAGAAPGSPSAGPHHARRPSAGAGLPPAASGAGSMSLGRSETLAAAVSAAASALAAHMREPQQLWRHSKARRGAPGPSDGGAAAPGAVAGAPPKAGRAGSAALAAGAAATSPAAAGVQAGRESPSTAAAIEAAAQAAAKAAAEAGADAVSAAAAAAAAQQAAAAAAGLAPEPRFSAEELEAYAGGTMDPAFWEPIHVPGTAQVGARDRDTGSPLRQGPSAHGCGRRFNLSPVFIDSLP